MTLGTLAIEPAGGRPDLLAGPVARATLLDAGVAAIDPSLSDTRAFCEHYQVPLAQAANCVILDVRRGEERFLAACVVLATTRIDVNGKVREVLNAKKASFAQMEKAVEASGMEYGAITPVGLPSEWLILIDKAVAESAESLVIGSGLRGSKLIVSGAFLAGLPNAQVVENLGRIVSAS
jgi:prolyl-tRNA editing enzyme YbaK/EbsC (Cys-tRNA(Pro) deacylase)